MQRSSKNSNPADRDSFCRRQQEGKRTDLAGCISACLKRAMHPHRQARCRLERDKAQAFMDPVSMMQRRQRRKDTGTGTACGAHSGVRRICARPGIMLRRSVCREPLNRLPIRWRRSRLLSGALLQWWTLHLQGSCCGKGRCHPGLPRAL